MQEYIKINQADNVAVALRDFEKGEVVSLDSEITLNDDIARGHKFALEDIKADETLEFFEDDNDTEEMTVTLEFDEGNVECSIVTIFECEGKDYIALLPLDEKCLVLVYFLTVEVNPELQCFEEVAEVGGLVFGNESVSVF